MSAEDKVALDRLSEDALSKAINITYADLVALRTAGELAPGQFYRITDYVTTTADAESRSMGHQFDLVVMAIDGSHLSEEAFAAHHDGDDYFANSALDAWRIWYCLDNDTTRFTWADTTNGKGVIYRMIDEYDNDVPYDFKNIQFKRYEIASVTHDFLFPLVGLLIGRTGYTGITVDTSSFAWYYTFSRTGNTWEAEVEDASLGGYTTKVVFAMKQLTNTIANKPRLLNNVFIYGPVVFDFLHTQAGDSGSYSALTYFSGWMIDGTDCSKNTLVGWFGLNYSESTFRSNLICGSFRHTRTGTNFENNVFFTPHDFSFTSFGQGCSGNVICLNRVTYANFGNTFSDNVISGSLTNTKISYAAFGNRVSNNTFADIELGSVSINGQFTNCSFSGKFIACSFEPICGYVDFVGGTNGASCVGLDVVGSVRGTSSSRVTISSSNFILPNASGTNRRIRLEGCTDGSLVATWKGADGLIVGIRSTDNGVTWSNYDIVPADVVRYSQQNPTVAQQTQARENLNAQENRILVSSESSLSPDDYNSASAQIVAAALGISTTELDDLCNRKYSHIKVQNELATVSPISIGDYGSGVIVSYAQEVFMGGRMLRYYGFVLYGSSYSYTVTWFQTNPILAEQTTNKVTSWQNNPDNTHYPSEKLVKDSIDAKYTKPVDGIPSSDLSSGVQTSLGKADTAVQPGDLTPITEVIPSAASAQNQLADKEFVNSSVSTATATFRGSYNLVSDLSLTTSATQSQIATALGTAVATADNNDYAFVQIPTSDATPTEIARVERYKYNGSAWAFEYALNNSGFTSAQWAALNSGITSGLVSKLSALPSGFTLVKGDGDMALGEDTTFTASPSQVSFENGTSEAVIKSYPGVKSKMVQTTVPNVTNVGAPSTWNFAMGTGAKSTTLIVSGGNGSAPQLGSPKTVATGELANNGGGSEVMTGLGTPTTANAVTNIGTGTAAAQNIAVGTNDKIKVAKFDDLSINAS